jgi:hypothetical protein
MATITGAAPKPRTTKTTKATSTARPATDKPATDKPAEKAPVGAQPMVKEPMMWWKGKSMMAELRKPLYAYVGAGDLALEKLREVPAELPKIPSVLSDEASRLQDALAAEMSRLQDNLRMEKMQSNFSVDQLRELPEHAKELRSQLEDYAATLGDKAFDLYQDLVARGERVVESHK